MGAKREDHSDKNLLECAHTIESMSWDKNSLGGWGFWCTGVRIKPGASFAHMINT